MARISIYIPDEKKIIVEELKRKLSSLNSSLSNVILQFLMRLHEKIMSSNDSMVLGVVISDIKVSFLSLNMTKKMQRKPKKQITLTEFIEESQLNKFIEDLAKAMDTNNRERLLELRNKIEKELSKSKRKELRQLIEIIDDEIEKSFDFEIT